MNKELSIDKKLELLEKANWNYKDIADYFGCGITKASEIKRKARIYNGGFPKYMKDHVTVSAVFELQGVSLSEEIKKLKQIKGIYDAELQVGVA